MCSIMRLSSKIVVYIATPPSRRPAGSVSLDAAAARR